ncbi:hypothetical protein V500_05348 [Pseudogymnoascus sp. VKM F-4518 (FW-2643)]|nr:hypothetical protein V500_05348 [Pseudogymnoascus sp. VKM F-4518 (FW-2643)]
MQSHIWAPLGMRQITFHLHTRPDVEAEIGEMALRVPSGEIEAVGSRFWPDETEFDSGGAGAYSSMAEYVKVLIAVLRNDGTLLKPATMDLLFQPQLSPAVQTTLDKTLYANGGLPVFSANLPPSARLTQALGGTVCLSDVVGDATGGSGRRRNKGSLSWSGLPNVWWMIDPTA